MTPFTIAFAGDLDGEDQGQSYLDPRFTGTVAHDPTRAGISFDRAADGKIYFFEPGNGFEINVYDPRQRKIIHTIKRQVPKIAVSEDWAAESLERKKSRPRGDRFEMGDLPSHFPAIMSLSIDWADRLNIRTGRHWMGKGLASDLYDLDGQPLGQNMPPALANKIIAQRGSWLFVIDYHEDELRVWRIPVADLEAFLARP